MIEAVRIGVDAAIMMVVLFTIMHPLRNVVRRLDQLTHAIERGDRVPIGREPSVAVHVEKVVEDDEPCLDLPRATARARRRS